MAGPHAPDTVPAGLCPHHWRQAADWRNNHYDPRRPSEWPGGAALMDSRTSHAERERWWAEKNTEQIGLVAAACRSGRDPQCTRRATAWHPAFEPRPITDLPLPGEDQAA